MTPAVAYACNLYLGLWVRDPLVHLSVVRETGTPPGCVVQMTMGRGTRTIMTQVWLHDATCRDPEEAALRIGAGLETLAASWRERSARLYNAWCERPSIP